ncbi:hypothetical protein BDV98DRAFT_568646 [Pterulicium gracile]|uniref:Uncharacterized protein n=1 Tax=Pterulicium gracile TaxID=1884261 RepID=A0A5C3QGY8_9AGAR|nr:hypothetical protein BDV98DRAFT_568646 [Pterula gracilis]
MDVDQEDAPETPAKTKATPAKKTPAAKKPKSKAAAIKGKSVTTISEENSGLLPNGAETQTQTQQTGGQGDDEAEDEHEQGGGKAKTATAQPTSTEKDDGHSSGASSESTPAPGAQGVNGNASVKPKPTAKKAATPDSDTADHESPTAVVREGYDAMGSIAEIMNNIKEYVAPTKTLLIAMSQDVEDQTSEDMETVKEVVDMMRLLTEKAATLKGRAVESA